MTPTDPTTAGKTPTPTPRTDAVEALAKQRILSRPFGSSTADLLQELSDLYLEHAKSLERFLESAIANNEPWRQKLIKLQAELAAKDAELARLDNLRPAAAAKCEFVRDENDTLREELAQLREDVAYLLARQKNAGKCVFFGERDFGISSNSLVGIAYGDPPSGQEMPGDASDLHACRLAFERLPAHRKTDQVKTALAEATKHIERRDAAREGAKS